MHRQKTNHSALEFQQGAAAWQSPWRQKPDGDSQIRHESMQQRAFEPDLGFHTKDRQDQLTATDSSNKSGIDRLGGTIRLAQYYPPRHAMRALPLRTHNSTLPMHRVVSA